VGFDAPKQDLEVGQADVGGAAEQGSPVRERIDVNGDHPTFKIQNIWRCVRIFDNALIQA
jgi:hypothetical protein